MNKEKYREYFKSLTNEALNSSIDILFTARFEEDSANLGEVEKMAREEMNKRIESKINREVING